MFIFVWWVGHDGTGVLISCWINKICLTLHLRLSSWELMMCFNNCPLSIDAPKPGWQYKTNMKPPQSIHRHSPFFEPSEQHTVHVLLQNARNYHPVTLHSHEKYYKNCLLILTMFPRSLNFLDNVLSTSRWSLEELLKSGYPLHTTDLQKAVCVSKLKNSSWLFHANSFAFIADLDIRFNRHQIFTWWLRIPSCGSWENCLKYERNPEIARLPTLVPQRRPGSLQLASSVLVQHCQRSMDQTPA